MIYISSKSEHSTVILPKNTANSAETYDFVIKSQATAQQYSFTGLTDLSGLTDYLAFEIDSTGIQDGEYEYTCGSIEKGILRVGDIKHTNNTYKTEKKYKYYNG